MVRIYGIVIKDHSTMIKEELDNHNWLLKITDDSESTIKLTFPKDIYTKSSIPKLGSYLHLLGTLNGDKMRYIEVLTFEVIHDSSLTIEPSLRTIETYRAYFNEVFNVTSIPSTQLSMSQSQPQTPFAFSPPFHKENTSYDALSDQHNDNNSDYSGQQQQHQGDSLMMDTDIQQQQQQQQQDDNFSSILGDNTDDEFALYDENLVNNNTDQNDNQNNDVKKNVDESSDEYSDVDDDELNLTMENEKEVIQAVVMDVLNKSTNGMVVSETQIPDQLKTIGYQLCIRALEAGVDCGLCYQMDGTWFAL